MYAWKCEASDEASEAADAEIRPEYEAAAKGKTRLNPVTRVAEPQIDEMQRLLCFCFFFLCSLCSDNHDMVIGQQQKQQQQQRQKQQQHNHNNNL